MNAAQQTPVQAKVSRVECDFYPAWIAEHPDLFAKEVLGFLDRHPEGEWELRIGKFAFLVRLTAIAKAEGSAS